MVVDIQRARLNAKEDGIRKRGELPQDGGRDFKDKNDGDGNSGGR